MTIERETNQRGPPRSPKWAPSPVDDPIQKAIGEKLKAGLNVMIHQPVPDRIALLLAKLEAQELSQTGEA